MQIVKMMGGLGNQMFSYAFALALRKLGREVALDVSSYERYPAHYGWELSRIFQLEIPICSDVDRDRLGDVSTKFISRLRRKLLGPRHGHVVERGAGYDPHCLAITEDTYFDGFWQSYKYHSEIGPEIEAAFRFPAEIEDESVRCLQGARDHRSIGVHVRRGDFLNNKYMGWVCDERYYRRAITAMTEGAADPLLLFFSDDLDWCRDRLGKGVDAVYVDWNRGNDSWKDMRLMTLCDRLVIANSSFSWWGARLGADAGRPIAAPSRWFDDGHPDNPDIVPPGWSRVAAREPA